MENENILNILKHGTSRLGHLAVLVITMLAIGTQIDAAKCFEFDDSCGDHGACPSNPETEGWGYLTFCTVNYCDDALDCTASNCNHGSTPDRQILRTRDIWIRWDGPTMFFCLGPARGDQNIGCSTCQGASCLENPN